MNKQDAPAKVFDNIFLLLGSNLQDRQMMLEQAREQLEKYSIEIYARSGLYETEAWGNTRQPPFLNQALRLRTSLSPEALLQTIHTIEIQLGRTRYERWGPRCIDIDILYFGDRILTGENLKIPHPEIHNRKFALFPLTELAPDFRHPVLNLTNAELLKRCQDPLLAYRIDYE